MKTNNYEIRYMYMKKHAFICLAFALLTAGCGNAQTGHEITTDTMNTSSEDTNSFKVQKTDAEWRAVLSPERYAILRDKGTERPFSGELLFNEEKGVYTCAACGEALFTSDMKFDSHCGWPSFDKEIEGKVIKQPDYSHGMVRTEILCAKCGGHLGHIFDDGPTETGMRYCVNSLSLDFEKKKETNGSKP